MTSTSAPMARPTTACTWLFGPMEWRCRAPTRRSATSASTSVIGTASPGYEWLLNRQIWAVGTVNFAEGKIHLDGYMQ